MSSNKLDIFITSPKPKINTEQIISDDKFYDIENKEWESPEKFSVSLVFLNLGFVLILS